MSINNHIILTQSKKNFNLANQFTVNITSRQFVLFIFNHIVSFIFRNPKTYKTHLIALILTQLPNGMAHWTTFSACIKAS